VVLALGATFAVLSVGGGAFLLSRYYVETFDMHDFTAHTDDVFSPRLAIATDVLFACGVAFLVWARLPRLASVLGLGVGGALVLKPFLYPLRWDGADMELTSRHHLDYLLAPGVGFAVWAAWLFVRALRGRTRVEHPRGHFLG
jgi:hypothetical protein